MTFSIGGSAGSRRGEAPLLGADRPRRGGRALCKPPARPAGLWCWGPPTPEALRGTTRKAARPRGGRRRAGRVGGPGGDGAGHRRRPTWQSRAPRAGPRLTRRVLLRHRHAQRGHPPLSPAPPYCCLAQVPASEQATTTITLGELLYGAGRRGSERLTRQVRAVASSATAILPFDSDAAEVYGPLRARLEREGRRLDEPDRASPRSPSRGG